MLVLIVFGFVHTLFLAAYLGLDTSVKEISKRTQKVFFFPSWFNNNNTFWCFHRGFNCVLFALRIAKKCQITH